MQLLLFSLVSLVSALPHLHTRQDQCATTVQACGAADLTPENWDAFSIDNFLINFGETVGTGAGLGVGFPQFFVNNQINAAHEFDCSGVGDRCEHPASSPANLGCRSALLSQGDVCTKYESPEAGFILENFRRFHEGVVNSHVAMDQAMNNILNNGFIDDLVEGLSEVEPDIVDTILKTFATIAFKLSPFGRALSFVNRVITPVEIALRLAGVPFKNPLSDPFGAREDIIELIEAPQKRDAGKKAFRNQLLKMVLGTQAQLEESLRIVFGPEALAAQPEERRVAFVFELANFGGSLGPVPTVNELTAEFERSLKHSFVSSMIAGEGLGLFVSSAHSFTRKIALEAFGHF
jgi:hypothetical protein